MNPWKQREDPEDGTPTRLWSYCCERRFDEAIERARTHPWEARETDECCGSTPLHELARLGGAGAHLSLDAVKAVYRANPAAASTTNRYGRTPVHRAADRAAGGDRAAAAVVGFLVGECPESARAVDDYGNTPLHCICFGEGGEFLDGGDRSASSGAGAGAEEEVARILLCASPDAAWMENETGWTPLDSLIKCNHKLVGTALRSTTETAIAMWEHPLCTPGSSSSPAPPPGDDDDPAIAGRLRSFWRRAALLMKAAYYGTATTAETHPLEQVVHAAVGVEDSRHVPADAIMLAIKCHPGQLRERDRAGRLPLHVACANKHINGRSCKFHRAEQDEADHLANVDLLTELVGSHPEAAGVPDNGGRTPLHLALESGKTWDGGVEALVNAAGYAVVLRDDGATGTGLYPFMLAAVGDAPCLTTVYCLLRRCPELERFTFLK